MKLGVLFSGGKDSCYAMHKAMQKKHEIACLISVLSENEESYMFHTPNIGLTKLQAEAIGIPLLQKKTKGVKEEELSDLKDAIREAKEKHGIEGIVTGAVASVYQASRVQKICDELSIWCFNPLWLKDQEELLRELLTNGFSIMVSGVFAYPLGKEWLGRTLDEKAVSELLVLRGKYGISPAGEGGEIETTVLDAPFFRRRLQISGFSREYAQNSGRVTGVKARLVGK
jgi:diphthine-ammonia ligase